MRDTIDKTLQVGAILMLLTGCAALDTHQAKLDQKQLRDALMDYNEEQILDNLIRAYNGRAIVHFDVKTVTATVASKITPSAGYGRTSVANRLSDSGTTETSTMTGQMGELLNTTVRTTAGAASAFLETVTRPFTSNLSAERTNNVFVDVKPLDERKIYAAYIQFLNTGSKSPNATTVASMHAAQQELQTTKVTTTVLSTKVPPSTTQPSGPTSTAPTESSSPTATPPNPNEERQESTETKTEAVPKRRPDTGADLIVKAHPPAPAAQSHLRPLMQGRSKPRPGEALVGPKCWNNCYYWVPVEYRKAFFELCVATVTKGASPTSASEATKTEAQEESEEIKEQLEDFNSLQRLRLSTPP